MIRITPCLWFDGQAEAAANHYLSIFPNSRITSVLRWGEVGPGPKGSVLSVAFSLDGNDFVALNGGAQFKFTEAISLMVPCKTQDEVDQYWEKLSAGGSKGQCGWLKDKFGVSWQVAPTILPEMLQDKDSAKADRVMRAMMQMTKIDIGALRKAYEGREVGAVA